MAFNNEILSYFANKMWSKNKDTFVSKETGKSLSTNDYTNEDKNKLDNLSSETTSYDNTISGMSATNVQGAIDENASISNQALAIAKGRNQALAYNSYSEMITALNTMSKDELKRGQNLYIGTVGVPDLWVYGVETSSVTYSYVDDNTIVNSLGTNTTIQVGYYKLAQLETQKVDLTNIESDIDALQSSDTDINALITALTNRVTELENASAGGSNWTLKGTITGSSQQNSIEFPTQYNELLITMYDYSQRQTLSTIISKLDYENILSLDPLHNDIDIRLSFNTNCYVINNKLYPRNFNGQIVTENITISMYYR